MALSFSTIQTSVLANCRDVANGIVDQTTLTTFANDELRDLTTAESFPATKVREDISLFDTVYEYAAPSGYKTAIGFTRLGLAVPMDKVASYDFWQQRLDGQMDIYADDNVRDDGFLLIARSTGSPAALVETFESLTTGGTWAAVGSTGAESLAIDTVEYREGAASLRFNINVATSASIASVAKTFDTAQDLSDFEDVGYGFLDVMMPESSNVSSVTLRIGTDSSNYWSMTATTPHALASLVEGWATFGFNWATATETGTPSSSSIDYVRVDINYTASFTNTPNFRLDYLRFALPVRHTLSCYSESMVKTAAGAYQKTFTSTSDMSVLKDYEDSFLIHRISAKCLDFMQFPKDAERHREMAKTLLDEARGDKPNEEQRTKNSYYRM